MLQFVCFILAFVLEPAVPPVRFNQHDIERSWCAAGAFTDGQQCVLLASAATHRLSAGGDQSIPTAWLDRPELVFRHVLAHTPPLAIVYPTEEYYYFRFRVGRAKVSGNIRLVHANEGEISVGYFDAENPAIMRSATLGEADGVVVRQITPDLVYIGVDGIGRLFVLSRRALRSSSVLELLPGEEVVSGILDESGVSLTLLFHRITEAFYFVLNEDVPQVEKYDVVEGEKVRVLVGQRSGFVFADDVESNRKILVGVREHDVARNTMFDGPFDQVPPRLPIKEMLEQAYPYVKLNEGIDAHGNFVGTPGSRVAISPYQRYRTVEALVVWLDEQSVVAITKADLWLRWTYEDKRHFRRRLPAGPVK